MNFSTITLIMELFIFSLIIFIIYKGYAKNIFPRRLAIFAVGYEIIFNVGYMVFRTISQKASYELISSLKIIAALHGILSFLMLIFVVIFFILAIKNYQRGNNYFLVRKIITKIFIFFWTISLLSGIFLYFKIYF